MEAIKECQRDIKRNFPEEDAAKTLLVRDVLTTLAQYQACKSCKSENMHFVHELRGWHLRCNECTDTWPSHPVTLPEEEFPKLFAVLTQLNDSIEKRAEADEPFAETYEKDGLVLFEDDELNSVALKALQGSDIALSGLVFALFRDEFHCCKRGPDGTDNMWYQCINHSWLGKAELTLRQRFGECLPNHFRRAICFYEKEVAQTEDTKRKARNIRWVCEQLGDSRRRKQIMDGAIEQFQQYRPVFAEVLPD